MKKTKQITYLSALIIIIGSTVGAGIFFKNKELFGQAHGSLMLVISAWIVAGIAMIALGIAIVELVSASKTNRGTIEWFKNFLPKWMATSGKNYIHLIYVPITLFTMPLYVVETWQEAGLSLSSDWMSWGIGLGVFFWIAGISLISLKASEVFQWVLTGIKFLPVLIVPILAMVSAGDFSDTTTTILKHSSVSAPKGLVGLAPAIVLIGGIPAIAFAFDGFYEISSLKTDLKEPKKLGAIMAVGAAIILAIYLFVTIGFGLGSKDGSINGIKIMGSTTKKIFNIFIGIGIMGIVNGYMMGSIEQNSALEDSGESPLLYNQRRLLNKIGFKGISNRMNSWIFITIMTSLLFIVVGPIGIYAWSDNTYSGQGGNGNLYSFNDVVVNYSTLLTFALIAFAVVGGMFNRFNNKTKVKKSKWFWPSAIISTTILLAGTIFQFVAGIVDATGFNGANTTNAIIELSVLAGMIILSVSSALIENKYWDSEKHIHKDISKVRT